MREPRKFPAVLTGVMIFLISKFHSQYRSLIDRSMYFPSPLRRSRHARLCRLWPRDQNGRDHKPPTGQTVCSGGTVPLFARDPLVCASTALSGSPNHGEPTVQAEEWSGGLAGQVDEECVPSTCHIGLLLYQLGGSERFGQVCQLRWELCLVSVFCGSVSQITDETS